MNKILFLIVLGFQLCLVNILFAQNFEVRGSVVDSLQLGIAGASIRIYTANDSLSTGSDKSGNFRFPKVPKGNWKLTVRSLGFESHTQHIENKGDKIPYTIIPIMLKSKTQRLGEVQVKSPSSIRVAQDTVEYYVSALQVGPHDRLQDLLRQLPGVTIDASGNVTALGESMTKLRVNGKDFFTNNVKDFLKQLPAGIIAKLQVIDDYGDQANFSGIKVGKPQKMLNLVIKDGQSKGIFGTLEASTSTQNLWSILAQGNFWLDQHQLSANANQQNNRTEVGQQRNTNVGTNYGWSADQLNIYGNYGYNGTKRSGEAEGYSETITSKGTLFIRQHNSDNTENQSQQLQLSIQSRGKKDFWNLQMFGQSGTGSGITNSLSKQIGVILQDLKNSTESRSQNKSGNLALSWSRNLEKQGRNLSANLSGTAQNNVEKNTIQDQILFYDQTTGAPLKDSTNHRLLDATRNQSQISISANYAEPLNDHTTANTKQSIDLAYQFNLRQENQQQETLGLKQAAVQRIDSLRNQYATSYYTQQLNISYRAASTKLQYNLGFSLQPLQMLADTGSSENTLNYHILQVLPVVSLRYIPSLHHTLEFNYTSSMNPPSVNQLIPIRDVRNLQQVSVGNPDLKPSKNHQLNLSFTRITPKKGRTYTLSLNGGLQQDQVVSNVLLVADTLGSWRQEAHYLNASDAYSLGSRLGMTLPFAKYFQFRWNTQANKNQSIAYVDAEEVQNNTISWSQNFDLQLNKEKINGTASLNYYNTKSSYTGSNEFSNHLSTWGFSSSIRWTMLPSLVISVDCNYRINSGYSIPIKNPVLINGYVELYLTANKELSLQVQGYDLLDQQQSVNFLISSNTITQRTTNRIGRYLMLTARYNLSRFGGKS